MTYWTIQHREIVDRIKKEGVFYPDFALSPQVHRETYDKLLKIYNDINESEYDGLIFCIEKDARGSATSLSFADENEFFMYMKERRGVIAALNNGEFELFDENHLLCKIDTDKFDDCYPCRVDFWNFIFMMPDQDGYDKLRYDNCCAINPAFDGLSYEDFVAQSWDAMRHQKVMHPIMRSTIFQVNIPFIESRMLKGTFPIIL